MIATDIVVNIDTISGPFPGADDEVLVQSRGELQGAKNMVNRKKQDINVVSVYS
jgi:hypothetical protein